jgi:hypothetical protein
MGDNPTRREDERPQESDRDFVEDLDVEQSEAESVGGGASKKTPYDDESPK